MLKRIIILVCFIALAQGTSFGQHVLGNDHHPIITGQAYSAPGQNSIESNLFKPELVMKHQRALNLSASQKDAILGAYQKAQSDFTRWQWELQAATENLTDLVADEQIDEQESLKQLEKMLDLERNIKRTQLGLMIKIKNQLTPEQQKKLRELQFPFSNLNGNGQFFFHNYQDAAKLYQGRLKKQED